VTDPVVDSLVGALGPRWVTTDPDVVLRHVVDWTGGVGAHRAVVVRPGDHDEVAAVVRICAAAGRPVVAQGGNTGLVWGSVPPEDGWVVLATDRLDGIEDLDPDAGQVSVGAGVTLGALADRLAGTGWRYGVDFGARDRATIGGTIATNAGGTGVFRHGDTRRQLLGIRAVLGDGSTVGHLRAVDKDNTGYALAALLAGSEGTLGVVTAARLRLVPDPPERCTALVTAGSPAAAVRAAWALRRRLPELEACELLGPGCAALVAERTGRADPTAGAPAALVVETAGEDAGALTERLGAALGGQPGLGDGAVAVDAARRVELWSLRHGITEALAATGPVLKLDVSLPASQLVATWDAVTTRLAQEVPTARLFAFGHVCDHNLHLNVVGLDAAGAAEVDRWVLALVARAGGSISAEHGIGRRRRDQLHLVRTDDELAAMAALQRAWDPAGILNPGALLAR